MALLILSAAAHAQSSSGGHDQEAEVFGDNAAINEVTSTPETHPLRGTAPQRSESGQSQHIEQPQKFIPVPSTTPLKLAPSKSNNRVIPIAAQAAESEQREPDKLALQFPKKKSSASRANASGMPSTSTMIGSLAIVVGLFLLVAWVLRRGMPRQVPLLPAGILEVMGRAPLVGRQQVHLVRLGNKLLLLAITPSGIETLTEVTDPVEIDRLAGICQQSGPFSSTKAFNQVLGEFSAPQPTKRASFTKEEPDFSGLAAATSYGNRERNRA